MANSMRPRTLAIIFGVFFALVAYFAWTFAATLPAPGWFDAGITRWIYTTYMLVAAIFLVGMGGLALSIRRSFARQIRELEGKLEGGYSNPGSNALPPPLPDTTSSRDHVDRDIDELLESLSEVEASAARDARAMDMEPGGGLDAPTVGPSEREVAIRRTRLIQRQKLLGRYIIGPAAASALILGISGMMLPGSDGFAQAQFVLNTALILGISYSWIGVGAYIAATVAALVSRGGGKGKRK
jgi:hypothetical protein